MGRKTAAELFEVISKNASSRLQPALDLPEQTYASITEKPFHFRKDGNIIKAGMKTVLHHIDDMTVVKEVQDVLFYNINGILVDDVAIQEMPYLGRTCSSRNCLL